MPRDNIHTPAQESPSNSVLSLVNALRNNKSKLEHKPNIWSNKDKTNDIKPPGLHGTQLVGIIFGGISFLSLSYALFNDKWLVEEHLTPRFGSSLPKGACGNYDLDYGNGKERPVYVPARKTYFPDQEESLQDRNDRVNRITNSTARTLVKEKETTQFSHHPKKVGIEFSNNVLVSNRPVAKESGYKGLWRECVVAHHFIPNKGVHGTVNFRFRTTRSIGIESFVYSTPVMVTKSKFMLDTCNHYLESPTHFDPVHIAIIVLVVISIFLFFSEVFKTVEFKKLN